jgi:hypothetical protein
MALPARLGVAAACPACAAPLDFVEGASCARCSHCGTRLLLPGRRHVLTCFVPPRTAAAAALATARGAGPGAHDPVLSFVPYYRFTAEELRWQWPLRPGPMGLEPDESAPAEFGERVVERSFLACAWDGLGLYSIGVRAGVLRLALFRADALPGDARVVVPETTPEAALAHALRMVDQGVAQRALVGAMLGLVYFPFWVVPLGTAERCRFAMVDAVTGALVTAEGPPRLVESLVSPPETAATPLPLRPLLCPNCGWDLPDDPDHVVFYCAQCAHAWQLDDDRLAPLDCAVVAPPASCAGAVQHLPMWLVEAPSAPPAMRRIVVPAFRHHALRLQLTLAERLTRKAIDVPAGTVAPSDPAGAYVDREDALSLARFIAAGIDRTAAATADLAAARVLWWPFERLPGSYREPTTGFALPAAPAALTAAAARSVASGRSGS